MIEPMQKYYRISHHLKEIRELSEQIDEARKNNIDIDSNTLQEVAEYIPEANASCYKLIDESKRDLANRIKRRKKIIILVLIWPILAILAGIVFKFVTNESWIWLLYFLYPAFMIGTYSLCWVGFPVGWKKFRELGGGSNNPIIILVSFVAGLITMSFSYFIAIVKIFSEKSNISYINHIILELNRTLERTKSMQDFLAERSL